MQALFTDGRRTICWIPCCLFVTEAFLENGMGNLEAKMKDGSLVLSDGSGGRQTKCKISAAEVPI